MRKQLHYLVVLTVFLVLAGCTLPRGASPTAPPYAVFTQAHQTVQVELTRLAPTQGSPSVPSTETPVATSTLTPTLTLPPPPPPATITPTQVPCNLATFISDVTIPDNTEMTQGQAFTKTWRIKNVGTCTWNSAYQLVFDSSAAMGGPASKPLTTGTVSPGQMLDVSVDLIAPSTLGTHTGNWKFRDPGGVIFGTTTGGPIWVKIKVVVSSSGFDLHTQAPSAEWISCGSPCMGGTVLTFGGPDNDANGFVMYKNGALLENGSSPVKVLETHPMWVDDGVISGLYPAYNVQAGEHFKAKIGFLAKSDGTCGAGNAVFQVNYKEGGTLHPLGSWTDSCDGNLISINIDLSSIAGHTVQFALVVLANGSSSQDWAVWVNPGVGP